MFILKLILGSFSLVHAIESLPCQRALGGAEFVAPDGVKLILEPNQVVLRGKLSEHWETGMEDRTAWSIIDHQTFTQLSADSYDALFSLGNGDRVYILGEDGQVMAQGFHHETNVAREVEYDGRKIPVLNNRPRLLRAPESEGVVMAEDEYEDEFGLQSDAVVVSTLNPKFLEHVNTKLEPLIAAAETHQNDPTRFISIGGGKTVERQVFEQSSSGRIETRDDGRVRLQTADGPMRLIPGDRLYLIGDKSEDLGQIELWNFPATLKIEDRGLALRSRRAVLIRRRSDSGIVETDF